MSNIKSYPTAYGVVSCYQNDIVFNNHLASGRIYEESMILQYIIPLLTSDDNEKLILDIGGHIGSHTIIYSILVPCKIHTFEPQGKIYELLKKNTEDNKLTNVQIYHCAVGHKNTKTTMSNMLYDGYDCPIKYDTNATMNYGGIGLGQSGESINMITVDSLGLKQCDYIKMDVEGAEILVFLGARQTLETFKPFIWFENTDKTVSNEMKESLSIDFEIPDIFDYLSHLGYKFYKLDGCNVLAYHNTNSSKIEGLFPSL